MNGTAIPILLLFLALFLFIYANLSKPLKQFLPREPIAPRGTLLHQQTETSPQPAAVRTRQEKVCNHANQFGQEWIELCTHKFIQTTDEVLLKRIDVNMVQIGAHTGFEDNDPFAKGIENYLTMLAPEERQRFHWTFVEPSPANYASLQNNVANYSHLCDMTTVNAAIVSDSMANNTLGSLTFHSVRDTIDPVTGYDSLSGKTFPVWITQVSGFSIKPIAFNRIVWKRLGLRMEDYIVKTNVTTRRYSELMETIMRDKVPPLFVLIDTEGFDCDIVLGMSADSSYLPQYLVYEHKQCGREKQNNTLGYLSSLGYTVKQLGTENTFGCRRPKARL